MPVQDQVPLPVRRGMLNALGEVDLTEVTRRVVVPKEVHEELVVVADRQMDRRVFLRELEQTLDDIDVFLRVLRFEQSRLFPAPDIDDVSVEVERIELVLFEKAVDQFGFRFFASKM